MQWIIAFSYLIEPVLRITFVDTFICLSRFFTHLRSFLKSGGDDFLLNNDPPTMPQTEAIIEVSSRFFNIKDDTLLVLMIRWNTSCDAGIIVSVSTGSLILFIWYNCGLAIACTKYMYYKKGVILKSITVLWEEFVLSESLCTSTDDVMDELFGFCLCIVFQCPFGLGGYSFLIFSHRLVKISA